MTEQATIRIKKKGLSIRRRLKAEFTLAFDEDWTYGDVEKYLSIEGVLDPDTIFGFIRGAEPAVGPEYEVGDALEHLMDLLEKDPEPRKEEIESLKKDLRN